MTFTDPNQPDPERTVTLSRKQIKRLEDEAKEGKAAKERVAELEKERAYAIAGVPLDDPRFKYFVAGYQGETAPEAIKAEWANAFGQTGTGQTTGQQQHQEQVDYELGKLSEAQDLATAMPNIPLDKLAERDAKLAALNPTDPRMGEKFDAIFEQYGGKRGGMVG